MNFARIPCVLKQRPQWVNWREEIRYGQPTKVPFTPQGTPASVTNRKTWSEFEDVLDLTDFKGVGFVFSDRDPYCGIDLDACILSGVISQGAQYAVDHFSSYTELSPSGEGLHIIVVGSIPGPRRRNGLVELYDSGRFFCLTGEDPNTGIDCIRYRQSELEQFYATQFPCPKTVQLALDWVCPEEDAALLRQIRNGPSGRKFIELWEGRWKALYPSQSEADLAMCGILSFYCRGDAARVDRLFRQSKLYRSKWERLYYRSKTLQRAAQ